MDMGKYIAIGVLAVIVLAAATYESPKNKTAKGQDAIEEAEEEAPPGPVFEATFGPAQEGPTDLPLPSPVPESEAPASGGTAPAPEIAAASAQLKEYTVKAGQTLCDISQELFGNRGGWKRIYEANKDRLPSPDQIREGMKLVYGLAKPQPSGQPSGQPSAQPASAPRAQAQALPASVQRAAGTPKTYTVAKGETLYAIAGKLLGKGTRWKELAELNKLDGGLVRAGQVLVLPAQ
jgi:nucleoid-associated protein YgaU